MSASDYYGITAAQRQHGCDYAQAQRKLIEMVATVERCLKNQGIRFFIGRAGVWTTVDLVNAAGGLKSAVKSEAYSPDLIS